MDLDWINPRNVMIGLFVLGMVACYILIDIRDQLKSVNHNLYRLRQHFTPQDF